MIDLVVASTLRTFGRLPRSLGEVQVSYRRTSEVRASWYSVQGVLLRATRPGLPYVYVALELARASSRILSADNVGEAKYGTPVSAQTVRDLFF